MDTSNVDRSEGGQRNGPEPRDGQTGGCISFRCHGAMAVQLSALEMAVT